MREILFRGKRIDNGEWVIGDFLKAYCVYVGYEASSAIYDGKRFYEVIPETIGQFTGLTDKNGVKIFEGDIVKWTFGKHYWEAIIQGVPNSQSINLYAIETFHNCTKDAELEEYTYERSDSRQGSRNDITYLSPRVEITGNIHDNPELLKY